VEVQCPPSAASVASGSC
jgi:hypothetical protein